MDNSNKTEQVIFLLQKGYESIAERHNLQKACDCYKEARNILEEIYGRESRICNIVNIFDYIREQHYGNYKIAALKLADVGELLENFGEQDVVDSFTELIYESKEDLMDEVVAKTLEVIVPQAPDISSGDLLLQALLYKNDIEALLNKTFIDPIGLPHKFQYLTKIFTNNFIKSNENSYDEMAEMLSFFTEMENKDMSSFSQYEKKNIVNRIVSLMQKYQRFVEKYSNSKGLSIFLNSTKERIDYDISRGMLNWGDPLFAESFLNDYIEKNKNIYVDVDSEIKIMILECWTKYCKEERAEAEVILNSIIELENNIIMDAFFLKDEHKKIEFLNGLSYIMKRTADLCYKIKGAMFAYTLILRTGTLSIDNAVIRLDSIAHKNAVFKLKELEMMESRGVSNSDEKEKLTEYLAEANQGIFTLDVMDVCRKLTDRQAIIEFATMKDIYDKDYYCAFVVTIGSVYAIDLGACDEIDPLLDKIIEYISNYKIRKSCDAALDNLSEYHSIYDKVLVNIGKKLPQKIVSLYISAAGKFLQVPLGIFPGIYRNNGLMEDEYCILYINSGKEILCDFKSEKNCNAVVIGCPDFEGTFPELPFSLQEVEAISEILNVTPIIGKNAVPDCLKTSAGIFHISTHSYNDWIDEDEAPIDKCGLVFASGQKLSAREISQLDLSKTDLVVLSVCGTVETENGYSGIGEGIRRAFINSGAGHIILNLWETDDCAASLLMRCFYDFYINDNMPLGEALKNAKYFIRTATAASIRQSSYYNKKIDSAVEFMKEDETPYSHPYYWAGFIIVGT